MAIHDYFKKLPDSLSAATWIPAPRRPEIFGLSNELLQRYKRDFASEASELKFSWDPYFHHRVFHAATYLLPFLTEALDTSNMRALEVGSGDGATSAILCNAFREYVGVELYPPSVTNAERFCRGFGLKNVYFLVDEAANLEAFLAKQEKRFDLIVLHAVVEHLLPEERIPLLRTCWDYLDEDGYLFIGEAPSGIFFEDRHSSFLPYFQQMPLEMWKYFYEESGNRSWVSELRKGIEEDCFELRAFRQGIGVGFREIEKGLALSNIGDMRQHTVADNFNVFMLNRYDYDRFDFLKLSEIRQFKQFHGREDVHYPDLPDCFSRHYIEVLLRKKLEPAQPSDWIVISLQEAPQGTSEMVIEGKRIRPREPYWIHLPSSLRSDGPVIEVMLQAMDPNWRGVLRCETQSGALIFERDLWRSMRLVSEWRARMTFQLPPVRASDFPIKISTGREEFVLTYVFLRSEAATDAAKARRLPRRLSMVTQSKVDGLVKSTS